MFDLIPFGRNERNLLNYLDNVERSFWDGSISTVSYTHLDVYKRQAGTRPLRAPLQARWL